MAEENKEETTAEVVNEEEVEDLEWSADQEVLLLYSLNGYKPVGRDKHFHMMIIQERLSNAMNISVSSKAIWKKLNSWYDLEALDEAEAEVDAAEAVDVDFTLPQDEFGSLMSDKIKGPVIKVEKIQIQQQTISTLTWNQRQVVPEPSEPVTVEVKQEPEEEEETNVRRMNRSKTATPVKDQAAAIKKDKDTPKKEAAGKKEVAKEVRKSGKEEDKKESKKATQEVKKDAAKEDKKDPGAKTNKRESTDKKSDKKEEKEAKKEVKKLEVSKTPKRAETPKQMKEVPKQTKVKGETPKLQKADGKKEVTEKKTVEKKVEVKVEKTTESPRGERLRTRGGEKKEEPEKPETLTVTGTKRDRNRESTGSADEPVAKKMKGRTRNSIEPNPPPPSPPRRRTRVS